MNLKIPLIIIGVVLSLWGITWFFLINNQYLCNYTERGQFGDMFGVINSLFSGLAFGGVIYTIFQQHKEIRSTRDEFMVQRFEIAFFNWLQQQNEIVKSMDLQSKKTGEVISRGRDCFKKFYNKLMPLVSRERQKMQMQVLPMGQQRNTEINIGDTLLMYVGVHKYYQGDLGHYFRNLYQIIRYINEAKEIEDVNKIKYIRIVRSQLSSYELVFLFYNCLSQFGRDNFKGLVEKYALLKNIDRNLLIEQNHIYQYSSSALGFKTWEEDNY